MLLPQAVFPQKATDAAIDVDATIAAIAQSCPINYQDGWDINAVTCDADTVHLELLMPSSLAGFLPQLTGEGYNVKRLWVKQVAYFGEPWKQLCQCLLTARRVLVLDLRPRDSRVKAEVVVTPDELQSLTTGVKQ